MRAGDLSSFPPAPDASGAAIQHQAAEWVALREARELTAVEQKALVSWRAADPRHAAMLEEVEAAWRKFDGLAFYQRRSDLPVDPDLLVRSHSRWRPAAVALVGMAAILVLAVPIWWRWQRPGVSSEPPAALVESGPRFLHLPDGSTIELNIGGQVIAHFTPDERRVSLVKGEAHFEVAKNPLRPFIVEANGVSVRAVGTAFDVRLSPSAVDVLVTEGKVGVTSIADPALLAPNGGRSAISSSPAALGPGLLLKAGQRVAVPTAFGSGTPVMPVVESLAQPEIERVLAWQTSRMMLDAVPLADLVAQFNRSALARDGQSAVRLRVVGSELGALRISGRLRSDSAESFVEVLKSDFGVTAERRGSEIILRKER